MDTLKRVNYLNKQAANKRIVWGWSTAPLRFAVASPTCNRWAAGCILLNGAMMDDTKRKLLKLVLVCLICIGLVTGLGLIIQSVIR